MMQNFYTNNVSASELILELNSFGIEIQENQLGQFLNILSITSEEAVVECKITWPVLPPGVMGMMVPKTSYYIKTKRAALILAATLLDATALAGLASASLAFTGVAAKSVVKVSQENGEYCILTHAYDRSIKNSKNIKPKKIHEIIFGNRCPFNEAGCKFMTGNDCGAKIGDIKNIYELLSEKEILRKEAGDWKLINKI